MPLRWGPLFDASHLVPLVIYLVLLLFMAPSISRFRISEKWGRRMRVTAIVILGSAMTISAVATTLRLMDVGPGATLPATPPKMARRHIRGAPSRQRRGTRPGGIWNYCATSLLRIYVSLNSLAYRRGAPLPESCVCGDCSKPPGALPSGASLFAAPQ